MKKLNYFLSSIAIVAMLFTSCSKEDQSSDVVNGGDETSVVLTFNSMLNDLSNKAMQKAPLSDIPDCMDGTPTSVEITLWVEGEAAPRVVTVDVLGNAADGYFTAYSELLKIQIANDGDDTTDDGVDFTLQGFKVFAGADLLWVAPVRTTADVNQFAGYVEKSLPFKETVYRGSKPYFNVEVLCFDERMVNEYGYPFFDIEQKEIFNFCLFGNFCTPNGKHFVANYSVDVWTYVNGIKDVQIYNDLTSTAVLVNGVYAETPLCVALPDDPNTDDDEYYFEITLLDSPEYDSDREGTIIRSGVLTEFEAKTLFVGDDKLEYYHFMEGCDDDDTPPIFNDPTSNTTTYYACLRELNNSNVAAVAYVTLDGNKVKTQIAGFGLDNGLHPQHVHGKTDDTFNSTCPDMSADLVINGGNGNGLLEIGEGLSAYGGPQLFLTLTGAGDNTGSDFPVTTNGVLMYERTVTLGTSGFPSMADMTPLDRKTIVLHGMKVNGSYIATLPIACGQLELN